MNRKTKIICTIGPASESEEVLKKLIENGMNVARLNFSHGDYESFQVIIDRIKKLRKEYDVPLPILLDTKGPEFRIGSFKEHSISLKSGDDFSFYTKDVEGNKNGVSVSYNNLDKELFVNDTILVNDGLMSFTVKSIVDSEIKCVVNTSGVLSDKKSMSFPNRVLKQVFLSEKDKKDLLFGIKNDVDFVAASFVSNKENVREMREFLNANGGENIQIIAKIENNAGIDNAESILDIAEGLMVARGDLGVEVPYYMLPAIQKKLIKTCLKKGAICVTATEMLDSMQENTRPTRAEISDVANAVFDGSSAVMLSGETAAGKYPELAVAAMNQIALDAERHIDYIKRFKMANYEIDDLTDALSHAAATLSIDTKAALVVTSTTSGFTTRMLERCRIPIPIIGITHHEKTYRQMDLYWNTTPVFVSEYTGIEDIVANCRELVLDKGLAKEGDVIVVTGGLKNKIGGTRFLHADFL